MLVRYLRFYNYCIRRDMTSIRSGPQYAFDVQEYTATARMANQASLDAVDLTTLIAGWRLQLTAYMLTCLHAYMLTC